MQPKSNREIKASLMTPILPTYLIYMDDWLKNDLLSNTIATEK